MKQCWYSLYYGFVRLGGEGGLIVGLRGGLVKKLKNGCWISELTLFVWCVPEHNNDDK